MYHHVLRFLTLLALTSAFPTLFGQPRLCPELTGVGSNGLERFLRQERRPDRAKLLPACVVGAIRDLGETGSAKFAEILAQYLDYQRPLTELEQQGIFVTIHIEERGGLFPAMTALGNMGGAAVPALKQALAADSSSTVTRDNAAWD
jgi:hypothetical protein